MHFFVHLWETVWFGMCVEAIVQGREMVLSFDQMGLWLGRDKHLCPPSHFPSEIFTFVTGCLETKALVFW